MGHNNVLHPTQGQKKKKNYSGKIFSGKIRYGQDVTKSSKQRIDSD